LYWHAWWWPEKGTKRSVHVRVQLDCKPYLLEDLGTYGKIILLVQCDQKVSVHLTITIPKQLMIWRWPSQNTFGMWTVLYWTQSSRTQFGVSVNVWRPAGDTLNITCNPISRPTDATCDRFLFSIYMCITLHFSSIKRSSSGVPHRTYSLQFLCLCLSAALSCKKTFLQDSAADRHKHRNWRLYVQWGTPDDEHLTLETCRVYTHKDRK
jgi:hypothetical protein